MSRKAPWSDEVLVRDAISVLIIEPGAWLRYRQIGDDGAILVRPDRFIAWRTPRSVDDPQGALASALSQIFGRPIGAAVALAGASTAWTSTRAAEVSSSVMPRVIRRGRDR